MRHAGGILPGVEGVTFVGAGVALRFGEGRISGALSVLLGASAAAAVLCFHFPEYLTTPELRAVYPVELLRRLLAAGMLLAAILGGVSIFLSRRKRWGLAGLGLVLVAQWLGGAGVEVDAVGRPVVSFGLDWLVLSLLGTSFVFVFLERVWPHDPDQPTLRDEWRLDLVYFAFNHLMVGVVLLVTTAFSEGLFGWAVHDRLQGWVRAQPVWLQAVEVLIVADLTQYWGHRLMHEQPRLWAFHAVHHCPARMDWLSGSRMHFLEVLFVRSTVILPIYLLGFAEAAVSAYVVWVSVQAVWIHSNTRLGLGPIRHLLATPHFHHWHHAADAEAIDRNYAAHLPVLDRIFGTWVGPRRDWPRTYGVVGKPLPTGFLAQHLYPFSVSPTARTTSPADRTESLAAREPARPDGRASR